VNARRFAGRYSAIEAAGVTLDRFDWISIPPGKVTLETGQTFTVPAFAITRLPVTNADYDLFVRAEDG